MTNRLFRVFPLAFLLAACDGEGSKGDDDDDDDSSSSFDEPLTCDDLEDGCWSDAREQIYTCRNDETGSFNADRTVCTFPDGSEVRFDEGLPDYETLVDDDAFTFNFEMYDDSGSLCGTWSETATGEAASTFGIDDETLWSVDFSNAILTCADGTTMGMSSTDLFDCGLFNLPGTFSSGSGNIVSFGILGAEEGSLWNCE